MIFSQTKHTASPLREVTRKAVDYINKKAGSARTHPPAYCIFDSSLSQPNGGAQLRNFLCNKKAGSARIHPPAYCIFDSSLTQPNGGAQLRNFLCKYKNVRLLSVKSRRVCKQNTHVDPHKKFFGFLLLFLLKYEIMLGMK